MGQTGRGRRAATRGQVELVGQETKIPSKRLSKIIRSYVMNPRLFSEGQWAAYCRQEDSKPLYLIIKLKRGLQKATAHEAIEVNFTGFHCGPANHPMCTFSDSCEKRYWWFGLVTTLKFFKQPNKQKYVASTFPYLLVSKCVCCSLIVDCWFLFIGVFFPAGKWKFASWKAAIKLFCNYQEPYQFYRQPNW